MSTSHPWPKLRRTEKIIQGSEGIPVSKSKSTQKERLLVLVRVLFGKQISIPCKTRFFLIPSGMLPNGHVAALTESVLAQKMNSHPCQHESLPILFPAREPCFLHVEHYL